MKYDWFDGYLLSKPGCVKDYKEEWGAYRFLVKNKMFCMKGRDKEGKSIITLKCTPEFGEHLRENYKDIIPGYYMNKIHWNSVYINGEVPDDILKQMADMSYDLILSSLSKREQAEVLNE